MYKSTIRSILPLAAMLVAVTMLGCGDDAATDPEDTPDIATMRLIVAADTVSVADDGSVTGGPFSVTGTVDIAAEFLDTNGELATDLDATRYELQGAPEDDTVVTFTLTDGFAGTLTGLLAGESTTVDFSLYDTDEGTDLFGPFGVTVEVK